MPLDTEPVLTALLQAELLVSDLSTARSFYESALGLTPLPDRPALPYAREWYALNGHQQCGNVPLSDHGLDCVWSKGGYSLVYGYERRSRAKTTMLNSACSRNGCH
jgi:hypothetical protein